MKKKYKIWLWVGTGITILIPLVLMIVFPIILDKSWKSVWITGIIEISGWLIAGIIIAIKLGSKTETIQKIITREIVDWHIERIKDDEYIADNFILMGREVGNFGDPIKGVSPVLLMIGYLTEKEQDMVIIINLNNPKEQFTDVFNVTPEQIKELKELIADNPDKTIKEDIKLLNAFGNQFGNISRTLPSSQKERDKIEDEKIEKESSL